MKKLLLAGFIAFSFFGNAQTKESKNNISIGGGRQSYNGDLGNSWFNLKEEFYGFFNLSYSRYLNRSLDVSLSTTYGDYGHCRDEDDATIRPDGSSVLNMFSRLATGVLSLKYKFANGYIFKEDARLAPALFFGAGINNLTDVWTHKRVNSGNYTSFNYGFSLRYNFTKKINLNYSMAVGYFTTDKIDYRSVGRNDMYLQNTFSVGYNF